jgi:hypothetical protein
MARCRLVTDVGDFFDLRGNSRVGGPILDYCRGYPLAFLLNVSPMLGPKRADF